MVMQNVNRAIEIEDVFEATEQILNLKWFENKAPVKKVYFFNQGYTVTRNIFNKY